MTESITASDVAAPSGPGGASSALRIAVLDRDSGFIQVLSKRLDRLGWEHRVLASPVPADTVVSMRLSALVVDLAVLGPQAWEWLERLCGALPELGIVVCTGPLDGRPAGARAAPRRRRLDHQAVPPRGGHRARAERRAPPPALERARRVKAASWPARSRSAPTASRRSSSGPAST